MSCVCSLVLTFYIKNFFGHEVGAVEFVRFDHYFKGMWWHEMTRESV